MKYYILRHQYVPNSYVDGDVTFEPPISEYYRPGSTINLKDRHVSVRLDKIIRKLKVDFFHTTSGAFFAYQPLAALIAARQSSLLSLPTTVTYHNSKPVEKDFCLIHMDNRVDCFDYQKSVYAGKPLILQRIERSEDPETILVKSHNQFPSTKLALMAKISFFSKT